MKQQVINFEYDIIQKEAGNSPFIPRNDPHNFRYSSWELNDLLEKIGDIWELKLKWIGNQQNSNILAFFYCVLIGTLKDEDEGSEEFIKLKHSLYQESQEWLTISEQKIFVEHLCLIQYSKSVAEFLKKSNHFQAIIIKIFTAHLKQYNNKKNQDGKSITQLSKLQQLSAYSVLFPFVNFELTGQKIASLQINNQTFYIVQEKQCFFIVENKKKSSILSKKTWLKTQPSQPQIDEFKKQRKTEYKRINEERFLSPKEGSTPKFVFRNSISSNLIKSRQSKQRISVNIFNEAQQMQKSNEKRNIKIPDRKLTYDEKSLVSVGLHDKNFLRNKASHHNQSIRTSLGQDHIYSNSFLNNQRRISQGKDYSNSRSSKKISPNLLEQKYATKSTKNLDVKNINFQQRNGFVYQSLGTNEKIHAIQKKQKNKIPKFLEKKKTIQNIQTNSEVEERQKLLKTKKAAYERKYGINPPSPEGSMNFTFSHLNYYDQFKKT